MRRSLRAKLVVAYTVLSILAVTLMAFYVDSRLEALLLDQLRDDLHGEAALVAEAVAANVDAGDEAAVADFLRRADPSVGARVLVVANKGTLVATTGEEPRPEWRDATTRPGVGQAFRGVTVDEVIGGPLSGPDLMYVAIPVIDQGRVVGAVRVAYRSADVEGAFNRVRMAILTGALATAIAAAALSSLFAARISGPLRALSRAVHRLAEGDLSQKVVVRSRDEVGDLVTAFNAMAGRLREHDTARREFASDISHELHSLASAMQTAAEALERGARHNPVLLDRLLSGLVQHSRRLGRLADDLLELARLEGGRMRLELEDADLAEIARQTAAGFLAEAEQSRIRLVVDAPEQLQARADGARLGQALGNLVENALKYSPPGTAITVRARGEPQGFLLEVADEGVGIPREVLPRVFERYYRVEGRASGGPGGMGLGLSIVAGIARAHGGSVAARPAPGQGTIFTIHLPGRPAGPSPERAPASEELELAAAAPHDRGRGG